MKHLIVLLSGKQGSGKTTTADHLRDLAAHEGYRVLRSRFAGPLYQMHDAILPYLKTLGIVAPDCDKDGDLLQLLGTEYVRNKKGPDIWAKIQRKIIDDVFYESVHPTFITIEDARFENEFSIFSDAFRVRLECDRELRKARTHSWRPSEEHPSEIGLDPYSALGIFDYYQRTESGPWATAQNIYLAAKTFRDSGRRLEVVGRIRALKGEG